MKIKRIYHNYKNWEEYKNGMWRTIKVVKKGQGLNTSYTTIPIE